METHPILDLKIISDEMYESLFYTSNILLSEGIYIEEGTRYNDKEVWTCITLFHITKDDAELMTLYEGNLLSNIQTYRILKDTLEIYDKHLKVEFLSIMREMSISRMSSSMQSDPEKQKEIYERWLGDLEMIKHKIKAS